MRRKDKSNKHGWFLCVLFLCLTIWGYTSMAPVMLLVGALSLGYCVRGLEE